MSICIAVDCSRKAHARGLCPTHHGRMKRQGLIKPLPKLTLLERFMKHVKVDPETGCWLWQGRIGTGGYGYFGQKVGDVWKQRRAHRVSYELHVGPIPDGLQIHHECERPPCVNPGHLAPMAGRENTLLNSGPSAANARRTHCLRGHPFSGDNLQVINATSGQRRRCKTCARERFLARKAAS